VVSNDVACRLDAVVQIVPVTSLLERALRPYESRVGTGTTGLERTSRAVANQLRTIARHRIIERLGFLAAAELDNLDRAIMIQLGLRREP
jgi:mRNA interferase MazF